jgi:plasmid stability protein
MAQFTVRNLDDEVKRRLQARAAKHGVSMEEEVRRLLRQAVMTRQPKAGGVGSRMASRFAKGGLQSHESIAELRGHPAQTPVFDE